jgi:hypothetical protein
MGTLWELDRNTLGTHKNTKNYPPPPKTQKKKKKTPLRIFIACMKFDF